MSNKYVLMITALIIFIVILSEIHSNKTKQQLQNDLQKAEERLENSKRCNMEIKLGDCGLVNRYDSEWFCVACHCSNFSVIN